MRNKAIIIELYDKIDADVVPNEVKMSKPFDGYLTHPPS